MVQSFQFNKITENIYQILNKFISACFNTDKQFICPQILHYNEYLSKDGQRLQFLPFKHRCQPLVPRFQWCLRAEQKFSFTKLSLGVKCWVTNLTSDTNKIKKIKIKYFAEKYFGGNIPRPWLARYSNWVDLLTIILRRPKHVYIKHSPCIH